MCDRTVPATLVVGPFGAHYVCHAQNAPNDAEEDHTYAQMVRVRAYDAMVRLCDRHR